MIRKMRAELEVEIVHSLQIAYFRLRLCSPAAVQLAVQLAAQRALQSFYDPSALRRTPAVRCAAIADQPKSRCQSSAEQETDIFCRSIAVQSLSLSGFRALDCRAPNPRLRELQALAMIYSSVIPADRVTISTHRCSVTVLRYNL